MSASLDFSVNGPLTIQAAADQHPLLRDALASGASTLDLHGVDACDTAGVQLLLATTRRAQSLGTPLSLKNASAPVREALERYGLESLLAEPTASREPA